MILSVLFCGIRMATEDYQVCLAAQSSFQTDDIKNFTQPTEKMQNLVS